MVLKVRPKSFGPIFVSYDGTDQVLYGHGDLEENSPYPPDNTPVDTLIASLGACIVKSVQFSADQRTAGLNPFRVKVVGHKSAELPGRIEKVDITVIGDIVDDAALALRILKQAKAICTVSNSLNSEVEISVQED